MNRIFRLGLAMISSESITLLLALSLGGTGCAAREHVIDLSLSFNEDVVPLCFAESVNVIVVDLFTYDGPEAAGASGSACRRCGTGEDATTCQHIGRECRCGTFTSAEDVEDAFRTISFEDVDAGNVCVRLVALPGGSGSPSEEGDCTESMACPSPEAPLENSSLCILSALGVVGVPPGVIELNELSCPIADRLLEACADDACDCPFTSVSACLEIPPTADCPPDCAARVRSGCYARSRSCALQMVNILTTMECEGFTGT